MCPAASIHGFAAEGPMQMQRQKKHERKGENGVHRGQDVKANAGRKEERKPGGGEEQRKLTPLFT